MNNFCLLLALVLQSACFAAAFTAAKPTSLTTNTIPSTNFRPLHAKRKFTINTDLSGDVSSDGLLADRKKEQEKRAAAKAAVKSNLGRTGNNNKKKSSSAGKAAVPAWKAKKAETLAKQRNGDVDSTFQSGSTLPQDQNVQIKVAKRGNKNVTLVRGLTSGMEDRKKLLKELKSKLGGGGAMIDGVLELQGAHGEKTLEMLKKKGFSDAKLTK
eukprot:CAMPEP_0172329070 /NCGR_PEP_ID=MMETSP1058-20130122/60686_1 /TAXON_ID=83371 /ORGANISM="Detonula confervacea, Strain CCMP 353" /LENGTH=212 /DNA_ID=CAMNT_0013046219 /DNA_START=675 /DNA_END=1313 /DNA_ORIENTATION=+